MPRRTRRAFWILATFACFAHWCQPGQSQIVCQKVAPAGKLIVATVKVPDVKGGKAVVHWYGDDGLDLGEAIDDALVRQPRIVFTGTPGEHLLECVTATGEAIDRWQAKVTIGEAKSLAELAGSQDVAGRLSLIYGTMLADIVRTPTSAPSTIATFKKALAEDLGTLATNPAALEVDRRLAEAFGELTAWPPDLTAKVSVILQAAVAELGAPAPTPQPDPQPPTPPTPPAPPVVTAQKLWLVAIDDAETRTPAQTLALSDVIYWNGQRAKGHDFEHYQTGSADARRFAGFIKFADEVVVEDAATGKVLSVEELPAVVDRKWFDTLIARFSGVQ